MGKLENNCLVLLCYVASHPDEMQSISVLSAATNIPQTTLYEIIYFPWLRKWPRKAYYWALEKYAKKYHFDFCVLHGEYGKHLWASKKEGYGYNDA